jgi:hypothetical protein
MKYLFRGIYAFAIGMNVGILGLMLFTDFKLSFWNQVIGQVVLIGVFIYWLIQFEKYEKRKAELRKEINALFEELKETLLGELENLHRLSRDKRINRVLSEDSVQDEEGQENKKSTAYKRMQIMRDSENKKVATRKSRKTQGVSKQVLPKEGGDGSIK